MRRLLSFFLRSRLAFMTCEFGQTLMAAKGCGRRYLGIEREQKYIQIVLQRLDDEPDRPARMQTHPQK
jgi:DNA modification methylase